jgi:hypothetical protein
MANEITVNVRMSVDNGFLKQRMDPGQQFADMTGSTAAGGAQDIGTSGEAIAIGDVATAGYAFFRNCGPTNFVELGTGTTTFVSFVKLKAGESAVLRLGTNAPTARANAASVRLQYLILSD